MGIVMKIRLSGFVEAFEGLTAALEATRNAAAPAYREAVEDWAETTTRKASRISTVRIGYCPVP